MLNILRSTEDLILKLGQLTWYYVRRIFIEKYVGNVHHRLDTGLYLVLVHSKKFSQCIQETLLLVIYFERGLSKTLKKSDVIFLFEPSLFSWKLLWEPKETWNYLQVRRHVTRHIQKNPKRFLSYSKYYNW